MTPGDRVAWLRGPSGGLVIGTLVKEADKSPDLWHSRKFSAADGAARAVRQRIWACVEDYVSDDWPSHPGAKWNVPECDFVPVGDL